MKFFTFPPILTLPIRCDSSRGRKRSLWLTPLLFVFISATASADSFRIFFGPNVSGDNLLVLKQVAGANIEVIGGTSPPFFTTFYEPGSTIGGTTRVFFSNGFVEVGGNSFDLTFRTPATLFLSSFTLPTNGKDFTVPAQLRLLALGVVVDTGQILDLGGSANGFITFQFFDGFYSNAGFIETMETPEPGTLGLVGSGLIGLFALARKRLRL